MNRDNPLGMKGELAEQYAALLQALWSRDTGSFTPTKFKSCISRFAPRFSGYLQHDSQVNRPARAPSRSRTAAPLHRCTTAPCEN